MQHGKIHCAPDRAVCCHPASRLLHAGRNPLENHRTICRTGHYSEWVNVTEFLQLFTFHQHLRAYKKQKVLWQAPPGWMHTGRAHMLHYEEPDPFCPHGSHKDSFIPCSPSIPAQNGMYWHQVNSLPTTESQCCTSAVCSKALGFHAWLYGASPAPRGGGGRGESNSSNKRDSSWLPNTFLAKLTWAMATQSSCCQRPWVRPSLWPQI